MTSLRKIWRDHSLSIVAAGVGTVFFAVAIPFREGTSFDVLTELGGTFWGIGGGLRWLSPP